MLSLTLFEYLARTLPEAFILILSINILCGVKVKRNEYVICSVLFSLLEYLVRRLPINYGVHTMINIFVMIALITIFYKVDILMSIKASMLCTIFLFVCEALNMLFLNLLFGNNVQNLMDNNITKTLCGIPSLIIYLFITVIIYVIKKRKKNEYY